MLEKYNTQLVVKLTKSDKDSFFRLCEAEKISPSDAVRIFIEWFSRCPEKLVDLSRECGVNLDSVRKAK